MKTVFPAVALFVLAVPAAAQTIGTAGQDALENARSGTVVQWRNPDDGASGSFVPKPAFQDASGRICREFNQTVTIGGQTQQAWGTACRQSDGSWQLQRAAVDTPPPQPRFVPAPAPVTVYAPPPPVIYTYPPPYYPPGYYYARPYYSSGVVIRLGGGHRHRHHRHW